MMSSGPLDPSTVTNSAYPSPIVIPLDFVEEQSRSARENKPIDESGLYMISKAVEEFVRRIMREATDHGARELEYDSIAKFIGNSEFKALKEFFPERVKFGDIAHLLEQPAPPSSSQPSTSSR